MLLFTRQPDQRTIVAVHRRCDGGRHTARRDEEVHGCGARTGDRDEVVLNVLLLLRNGNAVDVEADGGDGDRTGSVADGDFLDADL